MITIAGGIILAFIVIAFLPELFGLAIILGGIALGAGILIVGIALLYGGCSQARTPAAPAAVYGAYGSRPGDDHTWQEQYKADNAARARSRTNQSTTKSTQNQ